jgi:hypothetical protein
LPPGAPSNCRRKATASRLPLHLVPHADRRMEDQELTGRISRRSIAADSAAGAGYRPEKPPNRKPAARVGEGAARMMRQAFGPSRSCRKIVISSNSGLLPSSRKNRGLRLKAYSFRNAGGINRRGLGPHKGHGAQQPLAVDRIRLGAPVASGHGNFGSRPTPKFVPCREVESEKLLGEFREVRIPTPRR